MENEIFGLHCRNSFLVKFIIIIIIFFFLKKDEKWSCNFKFFKGLLINSMCQDFCILLIGKIIDPLRNKKIMGQ